ncbi:MAG: UDP-N-acetylmuramate--L-alanine ligase [Candidatus Omnitrophica bacterium]|nr:UDP-N-acetylmuramate--L-alanine ligase [Candidatus Omnitrophota bacterium]
MTTTLLAELKIQDLLKPGHHAYFIGIGGIGMSGLARILKHLGLQVSGSDIKQDSETKALSEQGIQVDIGHDCTHIDQHDIVIYSSAVSVKNPERREAIMRSIPLFHRAEVLSVLMNQAISVAVTGTHGKTTTSSMIGFLMSHAGVQPTCLVGGHSLNFESNVLLGDPHLVVAEVDESDRSHLYYHPDFAVITNLEEDHLDVYQNIDNLKLSFQEFVTNLKTTGHLIYSGHDNYLKELSLQAGNRVSYGLSKTFDFGAEEIVLNGFKSQFHLYEKKKRVGVASLSVPGRHNVLNSVGAIAALRSFGLPLAPILKALPEFKGVRRRLEVKLNLPHLSVIDDYAHHPTEVEATIQAIRLLGRKVTVIFQPHRFSRTRYLGHLFSTAFYGADHVILTDIYAAGEENIYDADVKSLYDALKEKHPNVSFVPRSEVVEYLFHHSKPEGVIAFLGAGDITEAASEFTRRFVDTK